MRNPLQKFTDAFATFEDQLSVRTQIAAAVGIVALVLVGALAASAALISYRTTAVLLNKQLASVTSTTSQRMDRYMAVRQQEINLFSTLEPLKKLWQEDPVALRKSLEQLQASFSDFAWIGFAHPDGTIAAATGGLLEGKSVGQRPWFKMGLKDITVGDVHEAALLSSLLAQRSDGEPYRFVDLALPVRDDNGALIGVLGGHLNWDWARSVIASAEANDGSDDTVLSVVSKDGTVLLGPGMGTQKYSGDRLAQILAAGNGTFTDKSGNDDLLTAFYVGRGHRDYQGLNWIVTATQPTRVALAAAIRTAETILAIGALAGLVGVLMAFVIARRISHPIHSLTVEADRIGRASGPTMLPRQSGSLEVVQLTRALRSLLRRIGFAEEQTKEAEARASENAVQFKDDLTKLRVLADTDYLTGLLNRRAFLATAGDAKEFSDRYKRGLATLMIDIDHFKKINDIHGHPVGDIVIKRIAGIIASNIKRTDRAARFGGEEFVVLLREVNVETAQSTAERIARAIEMEVINEGASQLSATVSIGIAIISDGDRDVQDMIERADQALYVAKNTGRNRSFLMPVPEARGARAA